jgi:curved DNA-binding protein CbpA
MVGVCCYQRLGVPVSATEAEIRAAFRQRAVELAPERGGDSERFEQLKAAYEILSDAGARTFYDAAADDAPEPGIWESFRGGALDHGSTRPNSQIITGDGFGGKGLMSQLDLGSSGQVVAASDPSKSQLSETSYKLTHTEGFDAWLRNKRNAGKVLTGDDMVKNGMIPATGSVDTVLPELCADHPKHPTTLVHPAVTGSLHHVGWLMEQPCYI